MKRAKRLLVLALAAAFVSGCTRPTGPNFLIVVIDTLRADRLGCYGNPRGLTPFLDSLAGRGVLFENAYAPSPWTKPSIASMFTSRYQSQHQVTTLESVLSDAETTLAELVRDAGYATGGYSANYLTGPGAGFHQGFDEYRAYAPRAVDGVPRNLGIPERTDFIGARALEWLDSIRPQKKPWLLYLQPMEPHNPYAPIPDVLKRIRGERPLPDIDAVNWNLFAGRNEPLSDEVIADIRDVYDAEVASVDLRLRELFDELHRRGFLENTVIVVTSDHGEELKDHGFIGHDHTLYEEVVRVPLIVVVPGTVSGRRVPDTVSLVDLAPTLLGLAAIEAPTGFEGRSLAVLLRGGTAPPATGWGAAFSELISPPEKSTKRLTPHERAIIAPPHKMIAGVGGEREYFDLAVDPGERNGDALGGDVRARLESGLDTFRHGPGRPGPAAPRRSLSDEDRRRMRELGYGD